MMQTYCASIVAEVIAYENLCQISFQRRKHIAFAKDQAQSKRCRILRWTHQNPEQVLRSKGKDFQTKARFTDRPPGTALLL